jgi:hypothetical protein
MVENTTGTPFLPQVTHWRRLFSIRDLTSIIFEVKAEDILYQLLKVH